MKISHILKKFKTIKVLVVGDVSLDLYCFYDPSLSEPSRETGIPNIPCIKKEYWPGAAGNVAKNVSLLGAKTYLISVCGDDGFGMDLKKVLWEDYRLPKSCIVEDKGRMTFTYTKFINRETQKEDRARLDFIEQTPISERAEEEIIDKLKRLIPVVDGIIIEDQKETVTPGVVTEKVRNLLHYQREKYPEKVFIVDSRTRLHLYKGMILKPNETEFVKLYNALFEKNENPQDILSFAKRYGKDVAKKIGAQLFVTFSDRGILYIDQDRLMRIATKRVEPLDITGAGDAAIAGLLLSLIATRDPLFSAKFANNVAAISVTQEKTGRVTPENVMARWEDLPHTEVFHPDIDVIDPPKEKGKVKHIVFDFDGTLSTLREGWEDIMAPLMVEVITEGREDPKVKEEVNRFIEETTGIQTILQMEGLVDMIKKFGYVPSSGIKDAHYYKRLYRERILNLVKKRMEKVKRGEVTPDYYLIKGAKEFLGYLYGKGYVLYLASGTDKDDVIKEAEFLCIARYFTGGIYGSLDNVEEYSKHKVMEEIMRGNRLNGPELLVFGDGPVEMKDARAHGGIAVGVASYEKNKDRRWDLNKIRRLMKAGAQILIPDFAVWKEIVNYLGL